MSPFSNLFRLISALFLTLLVEIPFYFLFPSLRERGFLGRAFLANVLSNLTLNLLLLPLERLLPFPWIYLLLLLGEILVFLFEWAFLSYKSYKRGLGPSFPFLVLAANALSCLAGLLVSLGAG